LGCLVLALVLLVYVSAVLLFTSSLHSVPYTFVLFAVPLSTVFPYISFNIYGGYLCSACS
jgi:hypothetical protein